MVPADGAWAAWKLRLTPGPPEAEGTQGRRETGASGAAPAPRAALISGCGSSVLAAATAARFRPRWPAFEPGRARWYRHRDSHRTEPVHSFHSAALPLPVMTSRIGLPAEQHSLGGVVSVPCSACRKGPVAPRRGRRGCGEPRNLLSRLRYPQAPPSHSRGADIYTPNLNRMCKQVPLWKAALELWAASGL